MEIKKTRKGHEYIKMQDSNEEVTLQITSFEQALGIDITGNHIVLMQEQVKELLAYLQSFAESGTLEPQESTLQGVDEDIAMTAVIEDPKKRIEALIELFHARIESPLQDKGKRLEHLMRKRRLFEGSGSSVRLKQIEEEINQLLGE